MKHLEKTQLLAAIEAVNVASGLADVSRPVEQLLIRYCDGTLVQPNQAPLDLVSITDRFWQRVGQLLPLLEANGYYYDTRRRDFYQVAWRIAEVMQEAGYYWVTEAVVKEAQAMKRDG